METVVLVVELLARETKQSWDRPSSMAGTVLSKYVSKFFDMPLSKGRVYPCH